MTFHGIVGLSFFFLVVTSSVVSGRNVDSELQPYLVPLHKMTNIFLGDVIQTRYLTYMESKVDMDTTGDLEQSLQTDWRKWIVYVIGFTVCAALGLVMFIVMLLTGMIFPCCRCECRCGNSDQSQGHSRKVRKEQTVMVKHIRMTSPHWLSFDKRFILGFTDMLSRGK